MDALLENRAFLDYLNRRILCRVDTEEKRIALTFDDGPSPRNTNELIDLLGEHGVRATFFLVGRRVRRFPEIACALSDAGHELANHTWSHMPLNLQPRAAVRRELVRTSEVIRKHCGIDVSYMRPPMGWFNEMVLRTAGECGLTPVVGSIHPRDSRCPGVDTIVARVTPRIAPGAIIILHDGGWRLQADRSQTIAATARIIDHTHASGYTFCTLSDLTR